MTLIDVVATCCENMPGGNCLAGFPTTCPHSCAAVLVPFMDRCQTFAESFPDETFPEFHLSELREFMKPCKQVEVLYERGAQGACADVPGLPTKIESMNQVRCPRLTIQSHADIMR